VGTLSGRSGRAEQHAPVSTGANFVDLHVYICLYRYVYADQTPDFPLPFTYPPFAAVVFYPLHLLPFGLVAFCWTVGTMAALYGVVRLPWRGSPRAEPEPREPPARLPDVTTSGGDGA
jgi:hypothetical protein